MQNHERSHNFFSTAIDEPIVNIKQEYDQENDDHNSNENQFDDWMQPEIEHEHHMLEEDVKINPADYTGYFK